MVNCNLAKKAVTYSHIEHTSEQFKTTLHIFKSSDSDDNDDNNNNN